MTIKHMKYDWKLYDVHICDYEDADVIDDLRAISEAGYKLHSTVSNAANFTTMIFERAKEQDSNWDESDYADEQYEAYRDALFEARHESLWSEGD